MRPRQALIFTILLAALVSAGPARAQDALYKIALAKITFVGIDRNRYVLVEANFALDNHPLASLNESADPTGTTLFNRELPAGDHLFAAEISYRRAGGGLFSNGTGPLLHVSGSLQFHAEPGQQLAVTSRIQARVDIAGNAEWLSLSTVIDSKDLQSPTAPAQALTGAQVPSTAQTSPPTTPSTRFVMITTPGSGTTAPPMSPTPTEIAPEKAPPPAVASESPPEAPAQTEKPTGKKKTSKHPVVSSASKSPPAGGAMARLREKLRLASVKPKAPPAKAAPKKDAASDRLKSLLKKAAAKNGNP